MRYSWLDTTPLELAEYNGCGVIAHLLYLASAYDYSSIRRRKLGVVVMPSYFLRAGPKYPIV